MTEYGYDRIQHSLFVVEIKFSPSELTLSVVQEVKRKIDALIAPKNPSLRPVLVHVMVWRKRSRMPTTSTKCSTSAP